MTLKTVKIERNPQLRQRIESLRIERKRTIALHPRQHRENAKQALVEWVAAWDANLDLACCWHASDFLRNRQDEQSEKWLQRHLSTYFNKLVKRVYGHMPMKLRPNIARLITLEHADGVGWHAHGVISTPAHMTQADFSRLLHELWVEQMGDCFFGDFGKRIFWSQQAGSGYLPYILKSATDKDGLQYGELKGLIDVHNTRRP